MEYSLINICTKNYWNRTITIKIFVGGWVVYFLWDTVYISDRHLSFTTTEI